MSAMLAQSGVAGIGCQFCRIAQGDEAAHVVLDESEVLGFLDIRPLFPGHALIIPKLHVETLADLEPALVEPVFAATRRLSAAVERAMGADGILVAINNRVSQSVPHLHVHVVPRKRKDGLRGFMWPRQRYPDDGAMASTASAIRAAVELQRLQFRAEGDQIGERGAPRRSTGTPPRPRASDPETAPGRPRIAPS